MEDRVKYIKEQLFAEIRRCDTSLEDATYQELDLAFFRNKKTIRLTPIGHHLLRKHFHSETFDLPTRLSGRDLIALKDKVGLPYYLGRTTITLFSSKEIFKVKLIGDVKEWLARYHEK